jgi:hypothetical protein
MRRFLPFALGLALVASACGPAEVVVTMEIDAPNPDGEGTINRALSDVEVQLIPFDRDAVFDSMTTSFGTPEPEIPQELTQSRDEVQEAQSVWEVSVRRWNTLRDTLQSLNTAMDGYSRGEARYVVLFNEWQDFDAQLADVEDDRDRTFEEFTALQQGTIRASDSVRILQDSWADDAFEGIGPIFSAKEAASGLDWVVDTTDASGVARRNLLVKPGTYWVHARYELAYTELYWNVMIDVVGGEPMTVQLTRANAQERPKL